MPTTPSASRSSARSSSKVGPADRHPRRRAGPEAARRQVPGAGACSCRPAQPFRLDLNADAGRRARACSCRTPRSSRPPASAPTLLLDDGKLRLRVMRQRDDHLETEVVVGGPLSDRKGVNVPDVVLPIPALTDEGPRRPGLRAGRRASTTSACPSCSGPRTWPRRKAHRRRPRLDHGQDREAAGDREPGRHPGAGRLRDGGARRPRRGMPARGRAADPEAHRPRRRACSASRWWSRRRCWRA